MNYVPRALRRRKNRKLAIAGLVLVALVAVSVGLVRQDPKTVVPPAAYLPLLETIAKGESNGNYNAYFNNADNTSIRFTEMPVAEVLKWQEAYVNQGSYSSAVGRYQMVRPTLAGLVQRLGINPQAYFDEALQDRLAIALLERRGSLAYVEKSLTREQFAANLAQEWAALPKVIGEKPEESYYAHDGINKSRISIAEIYQALAKLDI